MPPGPSLVRSPIAKLIGIAVLTMLLVVPLLALSVLRGERSQRAAEVIREVAGAWASEQTVVGPILLLPYVTRVQENGVVRTVRRVVSVLPETYRQTGDINVEHRRRGIFEVPVWRGEMAIQARFGTVDLARFDAAAIAPVWEEATLVFHVADPRGLEREIEVRVGDHATALEPGGAVAFHASVLSAPLTGVDGSQPFDVTAKLDLKGSRAFGVAPIGRTSTVALKSNWSHPSFFGAFLPNARDLGSDGFTANWTIPHYARPVAQVALAEAGLFQRLVNARSGVRFFQPVDIYHLVERALKYGILVIGAAFVVVFLMEVATRRSFHPIQYLMVGAALTVFYLLLLSFAEHIGFAPAYALATAAVAGLVSLYVGLVFRRAREGLVVGVELAAAYGLLYVVLASEDYALLTGSIVVFAALAAVMLATVRTDWSSFGGEGREKPAAEASTIG